MDINSLPVDLLTEILCHVASCSFTSFFNAKLTCKNFLKAGNEDCMIYGRISMEKFPEIPWFETEEIMKFGQLCKEMGNPEALYRQGMMDFFSNGKPKSGIALLRYAVEKWHVDAVYAYGMILLCWGGDEEEEQQGQGKKMLESLKNSKKPNQIKLCRRRTKKFIRMMWVEADEIFRRNFNKKQTTSYNCFVDKGWEMMDEDYDECCDACFWEREIKWFCNMF